METNLWNHIAFHFKSIKVGKEGGKTQKFEFTKIFFIFGMLSVAIRKHNSTKQQTHLLRNFNLMWHNIK